MTALTRFTLILIVATGLSGGWTVSLWGQGDADTLDFDYVPAEIARKHQIPTTIPPAPSGDSPAVNANIDVLAAVGLETLPATREVLQIEGLPGAAAVVKIRENSISTRLNIKPGDMIIRLNEDAITDPDQLARLLDRHCQAGKSFVTLQLLRPTEKVSLTVNLPLPMYKQRYSNAEGAYTLAVPAGWFLIPQIRNTLPDEAFDSLFSSDLTVVAIIARSGIPLTDPFAELEEYKRQKLADAQKYADVGSESMVFGGQLGFRVSYRSAGQPISVSRMAFVCDSKRYVINVVTYGVDHTRLSQQAAEMMRSITVANRSPAKSLKL